MHEGFHLKFPLDIYRRQQFFNNMIFNLKTLYNASWRKGKSKLNPYMGVHGLLYVKIYNIEAKHVIVHIYIYGPTFE